MLVQLLALVALVAAWTANEIEIFRLRDAIVKDLKDEKATFYSWLGVKKNANVRAITKAYRKLSQAIHPDKTPVEGAQDRYSRLGLVHKILRSPARDTYDFYLKKGFPQLNSEGQYVFNRWKPSMFVILVFLVFLSSAVHYAILRTSMVRKKQLIQGVVDEANTLASANGIVTSKRTVKLTIGREAVVHPDGSVYFDGEKINADLIPEPTMKDTFLLKWFK